MELTILFFLLLLLILKPVMLGNRRKQEKYGQGRRARMDRICADPDHEAQANVCDVERKERNSRHNTEWN